MFLAAIKALKVMEVPYSSHLFSSYKNMFPTSLYPVTVTANLVFIILNHEPSMLSTKNYFILFSCLTKG